MIPIIRAINDYMRTDKKDIIKKLGYRFKEANEYFFNKK